MDLAHVLQNLSLHILVESYVFHCYRRELDLLVELRGPAAQAVQYDIHRADYVRMYELADNYEE